MKIHQLKYLFVDVPYPNSEM